MRSLLFTTLLCLSLSAFAVNGAAVKEVTVDNKSALITVVNQSNHDITGFTIGIDATAPDGTAEADNKETLDQIISVRAGIAKALRISATTLNAALSDAKPTKRRTIHSGLPVIRSESQIGGLTRLSIPT